MVIHSVREGIVMRTNIEVDDKLLAAVMQTTGIKTIREAVEQGLKALLLNEQAKIKDYFGKLAWDADESNNE